MRFLKAVIYGAVTAFFISSVCAQQPSAPVVATPSGQKSAQTMPGTSVPVPIPQTGAATPVPMPNMLISPQNMGNPQTQVPYHPQPTPLHMLVDSSDLVITRTQPIIRSSNGVADKASNGKNAVGRTIYKPIYVDVLDVLDRGEVLVNTKEQVRIRGARVPSEKSTRKVDVIYAREANDWLRHVLTENKVLVDFVDNPRDKNGLLFGCFYAETDGTSDVLMLLLEQGYARLSEDDLWSTAPLESLREAQANARKKHLGIWSEE